MSARTQTPAGGFLGKTVEVQEEGFAPTGVPAHTHKGQLAAGE